MTNNSAKVNMNNGIAKMSISEKLTYPTPINRQFVLMYCIKNLLCDKLSDMQDVLSLELLYILLDCLLEFMTETLEDIAGVYVKIAKVMKRLHIILVMSV